MKRIAKWVAITLAALFCLLVAVVFLFQARTKQRLAVVHGVVVPPIPIPYPLSSVELDELRERRRNQNPTASDPLAGVDLTSVALERALARGKHYLESRAGCRDCHGDDFGGKVIVDNPAMGQWIAPNITRGGVTKDYRSEDWVRIIRHGVLPSGTAALMPAMDFAGFSDQEVSDIAATIQSLPPVTRVMPKSVLGPVYAMLIATGKMPISAELIDHRARPPALPPQLAVSLELGRHLGATCMGCHGAGLSGGPIQGGDPSWPPAKNITFDATGIATWTLADFRKALKQGVRPDGSKLSAVMPVSYTSKLSDPEIESIYIYLKSVPKRAFGQH